MKDRFAGIKEVLSVNPRGLTIGEVSREVNVNRNSVAKYLDVMSALGQVEMRSIGRAKLYYLSHRVPISAMLNLSSDYLLVLDNNLKIVRANDNLLNLMKTEREAILGLDIESFSHSFLTSQGMLSRINEALDGKDSNHELKFQIDKVEFYFNTKTIPTTFDDGSRGVTLVMEDISERKKAEEERKKLLHDLGERVKELHCLYEISKLVEKPGVSLEEILQETCNLLPLSWQYPDFACARVVFEKREFKTENFRESPWKQSAGIKVNGARVGTLEVYYLEEMSTVYEGPFLREERNLIEAIAERLGRIVERMRAEEKIRALFNAIPDLIFQIGRDGTILDFKAAKEFPTSLSPSEFLGKKVQKIMPSEFSRQVMHYVKQALQTRDTQVFEYRLPVPLQSSNMRDFEARIVAIDENEVLGIVRDLTGPTRKRMRKCPHFEIGGSGESENDRGFG